MKVDGGTNCHAFWDKQLLYVIFIRLTSFNVSGGFTFLASDVGLLSINLPGYPTLQSLDPDYYTPTDLTKTLSLITL